MIKKIHLIWVGKRIPFVYQQRLRAWARLNPRYKVTLWTDSQSFNITTESISNLFIQSWDEPFEYSERGNRLYQNCLEELAHEEFASVSNILRHQILATEGGFYFDTDIDPLRPLPVTLHGDPQYLINLLQAKPSSKTTIQRCNPMLTKDCTLFDTEDTLQYMPDKIYHMRYRTPTYILYCGDLQSSFTQDLLNHIYKCYQVRPFNEAVQKTIQRHPSILPKSLHLLVRSFYSSSRAMAYVAAAIENYPIQNIFNYIPIDCLAIKKEHSWTERGMFQVQKQSEEHAGRILARNLHGHWILPKREKKRLQRIFIARNLHRYWILPKREEKRLQSIFLRDQAVLLGFINNTIIYWNSSRNTQHEKYQLIAVLRDDVINSNMNDFNILIHRAACISYPRRILPFLSSSFPSDSWKEFKNLTFTSDAAQQAHQQSITMRERTAGRNTVATSSLEKPRSGKTAGR